MLYKIVGIIMKIYNMASKNNLCEEYKTNYFTTL